MEITKIFRFEGSHVVRNCTSHRCSHSVHGHSYIVELTLESKYLDNAGMVYGFGLLKGSIKEFIDSFDHCHVMCDTDDPEYIEFFKNHNDRWILMPVNPSAEFLAIYLHYFCQHILDCTIFNNGEDVKNLKIKSVTVHETATGRATSHIEDVKNNWKSEWISACAWSPGVMKDWSPELKMAIIDSPYTGLEVKCIKNPEVKQQINHRKA